MFFTWAVFILFLTALTVESTTTEETPTEAPTSSKTWIWILIIVFVVAAVAIGAVVLFLWKKGKLCGKKTSPPEKKAPVTKELKTTPVAATTVESSKAASSKSASKQSVEENVQQTTEMIERKTEDRKKDVMEQGKKEIAIDRSNRDEEETKEAIGTVKNGRWQVIDEVDLQMFSFDISSNTE